MTAVLSTPGDYPDIRVTVEHLRRQSVAAEIELLIVATGRFTGLDPAAAAAFHGHRVVIIDAVRSIGAANAAGAVEASGDVVAFCEDHCFPDPQWAEALLDAYDGPWDAVAPAFRSANPESAVSRADFAMAYGPWMEPVAAGERETLPGHNTSYRRATLLRYGEKLPALLEVEAVLHLRMRAAGGRLYIEPRARVAHMNFAQVGIWLRVQRHCGRVFAGSRAGDWSASRRALYVAAAPLIPVVRMARVIRELQRAGSPAARSPSTLLAMTAGLTADGLGQLIGHMTASPASRFDASRADFGRVRYVGTGRPAPEQR